MGTPHYQCHDLKVVFTDLQFEASSDCTRPIPLLWPHQMLEMATDTTRLLTTEVIDIFQRNLNANFSLLTRLAGAKSVGEIIELHATHLSNQTSAMIGQTEELITLSMETALDLLRAP